MTNHDYIDPEMGFTSDVIRDPDRFVGRRELIEDCIKALNTPLGLIAVYGKRGVGKSSLLRQIQQMALGDYRLAHRAGLASRVPQRPRRYLTVYYTADQMVTNLENLLLRLCNDQDAEEGLLRLVPDDGKDLIEFTRTKEVDAGTDLKVAKWGVKGIEQSKYARIVENDIVQTFRNYISAINTHIVKGKMKRDGLLILLDEVDVIRDKEGIGSIIKSLSSDTVKFAICGIGQDLHELVEDHNSVERLLEEGAIHVKPMTRDETHGIFSTAQHLFRGRITFTPRVVEKITEMSEGYPYFAQLLGKECVSQANKEGRSMVNEAVLDAVFADIRRGTAFPTLERTYQRAIGNSADRQTLLWILAEQSGDDVLFDEERAKVQLSAVRKEARELNIETVDQLLPRLIDSKFGEVLRKTGDRRGEYEFTNPVFRMYVRLRSLD